MVSAGMVMAGGGWRGARLAAALEHAGRGRRAHRRPGGPSVGSHGVRWYLMPLFQGLRVVSALDIGCELRYTARAPASIIWRCLRPHVCCSWSQRHQSGGRCRVGILGRLSCADECTQQALSHFSEVQGCIARLLHCVHWARV